jgi:hypothetical protein
VIVEHALAAVAAEAIGDGVFVAGPLKPENMPALAEAGLRSVINNRPDGEGGADRSGRRSAALYRMAREGA